MATSAVPAAIDALLAILRAAPALAGVDIIDGPPTGDMSAADLVAVGWQPDDGEAAVLAQEFAYAGARRRDEEFVISCWLESWTGDNDVAARRVRAFELLAVVEDALRASDAAPEAPTLGGTVLWAHLTAGTLRQVNTDQGVKAGLAFSVACRARI
ncbi:hypothetical protein [Streptomyces thermolilacinus]|uniref:hypothetical protein n=1 Tax=Streptomyces thermolilacinus TaxID=285540 RepID=UPI0033E02142